jgi:hypothetical protein
MCHDSQRRPVFPANSHKNQRFNLPLFLKKNLEHVFPPCHGVVLIRILGISPMEISGAFIYSLLKFWQQKGFQKGTLFLEVG